METTEPEKNLRGYYTRQYNDKLAFEYVVSPALTYTIFDGDQVVYERKSGQFGRSQEYVFEVGNTLLLANGKEVGEVEIITRIQSSLTGLRAPYHEARKKAEKVFYPLLLKRKLALLVD